MYHSFYIYLLYYYFRETTSFRELIMAGVSSVYATGTVFIVMLLVRQTCRLMLRATGNTSNGIVYS